MMRKLLLILVVFFTNNILYSQESSNDASKYIPNIKPPTYESFKFSNYGNIPVGLFTGSPNINIPISNMSIGDINIPLSLSYSSNGIRVDELNGSVGLGWTFVSAGVITRTIRDKADDYFVDVFPKKPIPDIQNLGLNNQEVKNYLNMYEYGSENMDTEPDIFVANFCGLNAKFFFDVYGNPHLYENKNYKIEGWSSNPSFIITTENGIKYYFDALETTKTVHTNSGVIYGTPPNININAWYLTKIIDPKGNYVNIEYENNSFTATISKSQTMKFSYGMISKYGPPYYPSALSMGTHCNINNDSMPPSIGAISEMIQTTTAKQIKKITDSKNNYILFSYENQDYDYKILKNVKKYDANNKILEDLSLEFTKTSKNRLFLDKVLNNTSASKYLFEYYNKEDVPLRLSYSKDMWGYYNAKNNTTLIPQIFDQTDPSTIHYNGADQSVNKDVGYFGLLKKITYPTGGSTLINYENHDKDELKTTYPQAVNKTENLRVITTDDSAKIISQSKSITFDSDQYVEINVSNFYNSQNATCRELQEGNSNKIAILKVTDNNLNNLSLLQYSTLHNGLLTTDLALNNIPYNTANKFYLKVTKNQTVNFSISSTFFCQDISLAVSYKILGEPVATNVKTLLGGYRISSTIDNPINGNSITRKYTYLNDFGKSSIYQSREPVFLERIFIYYSCQGSFVDLPMRSEYMALTSSNINQLFSFNSNLFYDTVTEEIQGKGKIIHYYSNESDYYGNPIHGNDIKSAPLTNFGWKNGKELETIIQDNNGVRLKRIKNNYSSDNINQRTSEYNAVSIRKNYMPTLINEDNWNNYENLDIVLYKNISWFNYLQSQEVTEYFNGKEVKTTTNYYYDNPSHYQMTREETSLPAGTIQKKLYNYAPEKGNQYLIDKNMVGIPLQTTVSKNNIGISSVESKYPISQTDADAKTNGLALPTSVISYGLQIPGASSSSKTEVTYDKYDDKGNILQYTVKGLQPTVIIWGYNQTQPIVKIEGISYDALMALSGVSTLLNYAITKSNSDVDTATEQLLITALDNLRTDSSLNAYMISTYTYDPLIGVTSITPPSGIREIYKYDSANRLQSVVDVNGKILKEYQYNYKQ